jgi:2'-5' RNA ligase
MIRTFVAVELDPNIRKALGQTQDQARRELSRVTSEARLQWVRPESIHLTLKFLGDIEETRVGAICQALGHAAGQSSSFSVDVRGLGVFPDHRAPRVLWVGLHPPDSLTRLAEQVEAALAPLGFPAENKPFRPHLTLARIKDRSREIGKALAEGGLLAHEGLLGTLALHAVSLMRSELHPSGSLYTRLCEVRLGPAPP